MNPQPSNPPTLQSAEPLHCRLALPLADGATPPEWIMWMPAGRQTVTAFKGAKPISLVVDVTPETAATMQAVMAKFAATQARPYFDFDHRESEASAWPLEFQWRADGVWVRVEWSKPGAEAVTGKAFRSFSPTFFESKDQPARVVGAPLCMGGLVNEPAFKQILPLWAKDSGTGVPPVTRTETGTAATAVPQPTGGLPPQGDRMTPEELAAKQAADAQAELDALKAKNAALEQSIKARAKADAQAKVAAAVQAGQLKPKDEAVHARWAALIEADPANAELLAALPVVTAADQRITTPVTAKASAIEVGETDFEDALKGYANEKDPKRRGAIYAREFAPRARRDELIPVRCANSLGTVAADLITQRRLELLVDTLPILTRIARSYSDVPLKFGKTAYAQKIGIPAVTDYNTSTGWADSAATVTDITVTLNKRRGIQIGFDQEELSGTTRQLFTEQEDAQVYALGKDITDALYALITAGNFPTALPAIALADFKRSHIPAVADALDSAKVPDFARSLILVNSFYNKLQEDGSIVSIALPESQAAMQTGKLPMLSNMLPIKATNLPSTGKLFGFGLFADALGMVTSPDTDYMSALPGVSGGGTLVNITEPRTGITVTLAKFLDHQMAKAYQRASLAYGVAKGDANCGVRLVTP